MIKKYLKYGSEDSEKGLFLSVVDSNFSDEVGVEISEEEYLRFLSLMKSEDASFTEEGGYLSRKGKKLYNESISKIVSKDKERNKKIINYYLKRIKRELELGIIDFEDLDIVFDYQYPIIDIDSRNKFMKESSATKDYTNTQSNEVTLWVSMQVKE